MKLPEKGETEGMLQCLDSEGMKQLAKEIEKQLLDINAGLVEDRMFMKKLMSFLRGE